MELDKLEQKHKAGVQILKEREFYDRLLSEIQYLVKYIDNQFFHNLFVENLFNDMRGVFGSFIRQDLKKVFEEMIENTQFPLNYFLDREYMHLTILRRCTTNLRYQVKSLVRMPQVKSLEFKSSYLQMVSRKLNGEIQNLYRILSENYKQYFRLQFTSLHKNENRISLNCMEDLKSNFDQYFITIMNRFYQLLDAIVFVKDLFYMEIENEIRNRIASLFFERQDRLEKIVDYFIDDLKKNFIRTVDRSIRRGKDYDWIKRGFEQFILSARFEKLLRKVIINSLVSIRKQRKTGKMSTYFNL